MSDSLRGIALSDSSSGSGAFYTTDGGIGWTASNLSTITSGTGYTNATAVMSGQYAIITSHSVGVYYSTNYGVTWTVSTGVPTGTFYSLCMNGQNACVLTTGGEFPAIWYSSNAGASWLISDSPNSAYVSMSMNASGQVIAAGQVEIIYSTNNGQNWSTSVYGLGTITGWNVSMNSAGKAIIGESTLAYSTDGGANFSTSSGIPSGFQMGSMYLDYNSDNAIACNTNGLMYYSTNAGNTWTASGGFTTTSNNYNALFISGIYAIAGNGSSAKPSIYSVDSGQTWSESSGPIDTVNQYVRYLTGLSGIMSTSTNLYHTSDGGNNWVLAQSPPPIPPPICFKEGSKILTEKGYIAVQDLRNGDLIKTVSSGFKKIEHVGYSKMYNNVNEIRSNNKLYRCSTSEYPELSEDLIITGCHAILIKNFKDQEQIEKTQEVLGKIYITDKHYRLPACVDERTKIFEEEGVHTIWHFSLEHSDYFMNYGVYANGLLVETTSNRMMVELSGMTLV